MMQVNIENIFNIISLYLFYKELQGAKGPLVNIILSTTLFYDDHFSLYFQHGQHGEGVTIIESSLGTKQGNP
jgi:hypothetical protein